MQHFIIAGAQRSGTTFLHTLLEAHPEIEMAQPAWPEPKFFLQAEASSPDAAQLYEQKYFGHRPDAKIRGEKSTSYIEFESAAERMAAVLPDVKVVFLLRNPIARAISNYHFTRKHGLETHPPDEALRHPEWQDRPYDRERISVSPFRYFDRGRYANYLAAYARHLPKAQIKVLLFDDLVASAEAYYDLLRWLGVDPKKGDVWAQTAPQRRTEGAEPLAPATRRFLAEYFSMENQRLAREWNLNLSAWDETGSAS